MDPFHRVGAAEREDAREHLIERYAERIEVAAGIDGAVHAPGLLGRHIGERARDDLGRLGGLALARQAESNAEAGQARKPVGAIHQDVGRLDVLVDEAAPMRLAESGSDVNRKAQEAPRVHRRAEKALERLAAWILEQQGSPAPLAHEVERSRSPGRVELILQPVFVRKAFENQRRRMLRNGNHHQNQARKAAWRPPSPAKERKLGILPQNLQILHVLRMEYWG